MLRDARIHITQHGHQNFRLNGRGLHVWQYDPRLSSIPSGRPFHTISIKKACKPSAVVAWRNSTTGTHLPEPDGVAPLLQAALCSLPPPIHQTLPGRGGYLTLPPDEGGEVVYEGGGACCLWNWPTVVNRKEGACSLVGPVEVKGAIATFR